MKQKILLLLVLLLTAASGAWAEETLLVTINSRDYTSFKSGSMTFDDKVTVTFSNSVKNDGDNWGLYASAGGATSLLTVAGINGYTITSCKFYVEINGIAKTGYTIEGESPSVCLFNGVVYTDASKSVKIGTTGITKIEVYGAAPTDPNAVEVTTNAASEGATFTEASFKMPAYDATAEYELVRDMGYKVAFSDVPTRARLAKDGNGKFHFADGLTFQLLDNIDAANPKDITSAEGITFMVGKMEAVDFEGSTYYQLDKETLVPLADFLADAHLGNYVICAVASTGEYNGSFSSGMITLFQGYEVEVAAKEFITYYKDEPLYADTETSADAELYTISSVNGDKATLSAAIETAPSLTPLLIFNNSDEAKTFLLIPANEEPNLQLTVAPEFQGTLTGTTIAASTDAQTNYALNGKQFVFVKNDLAIGANKAWLSINTGVPSARIMIVFDETTKIANTNLTNITNGNWYDLNGRKLDKMPTKKGVYLFNGRKVVVR